MQRHLFDSRTARHEVARALFGADQPPLFEQIVRAENRRLTDTALRDDLPERRQPGADRNLPGPDAISDRVGESLVAFHDGFSQMFIPSQVAAAGRPGPGDDPGSALSVSHNINGWRAYLAEIRLSAIKPSQAGTCVGDSS